MCSKLTFGCICGEIDQLGCDTVLQLDLSSSSTRTGGQARGIQIIEDFGGVPTAVSMIIPEWLAKAIEDAILHHKESEPRPTE